MGKQSRNSGRLARNSFSKSMVGRAIDHLDVVTNRVRATDFTVYDYIGTDTLREFTAKAAVVEPEVHRDVALFVIRLKIISNEIATLLHGESGRHLLAFFEDNQEALGNIRYRQRLLVARTATKQLTVSDTIVDPTGTIYAQNISNIRHKTISLEDLIARKDGTTGQEYFTYSGVEPVTAAPVTHFQKTYDHGLSDDNFNASIEQLYQDGRLDDVFVDNGASLVDMPSVQERFDAITDSHNFAVENGMTIVDPFELKEFSTTIANTFGVAA